MILKRIRERWLLLSTIILTAITALSLWPLEHLPTIPGGDKTHHFIAYAALMFPSALRRPRHWLLIALFFIVWSGGIELIQPYVNRYGEWLDMLANSLGLFSGMLIAHLINHIVATRNDTNLP